MDCKLEGTQHNGEQWNRERSREYLWEHSAAAQGAPPPEGGKGTGCMDIPGKRLQAEKNGEKKMRLIVQVILCNGEI